MAILNITADEMLQLSNIQGQTTVSTNLREQKTDRLVMEKHASLTRGKNKSWSVPEYSKPLLAGSRYCFFKDSVVGV